MTITGEQRTRGARPPWPVALLLWWAALGWLAPRAGLAQMPPPATQPADARPAGDPSALLDPIPFWVRSLGDADPAVRLRAVRMLAELGARPAVAPLIAMLPARYQAHGRMRVVIDKPSPRIRPATQPDQAALLSATAHGNHLRSREFLSVLLSHERSRQWRWVRGQLAQIEQDDPPGESVELAERLSRAVSAGPTGQRGELAVRLVGTDGPAVAEMLNLLMAIYQRETETRFKQRRSRIELDEKLARARRAVDAAQRKLKDFRDRHNVVEIKRRYDEAARQAAPHIRERDRLRGEHDKAESELRTLERNLEKTEKLSERTQEQLNYARRQLDYLQTHPTDPRAEWLRKVDLWKERIHDRSVYWLKLQRQIDRLDPKVDRARRLADRISGKMHDAEVRIDRIFGDIDDQYFALAEAIAPLVKAGQQADKELQSLLAGSARLPPMAELASADSYAMVVARSSGPESASQPLEVRRAAADALGRLDDPQAVPPLIELLTESDAKLRAAAAAALTQITGEDLGADQDKWRTWWAVRAKTTPPQP